LQDVAHEICPDAFAARTLDWDVPCVHWAISLFEARAFCENNRLVLFVDHASGFRFPEHLASAALADCTADLLGRKLKERVLIWIFWLVAHAISSLVAAGPLDAIARGAIQDCGFVGWARSAIVRANGVSTLSASGTRRMARLVAPASRETCSTCKALSVALTSCHCVARAVASYRAALFALRPVLAQQATLAARAVLMAFPVLATNRTCYALRRVCLFTDLRIRSVLTFFWKTCLPITAADGSVGARLVAFISPITRLATVFARP